MTNRELIRTIELPLSPNYVRSWGAAQAVRELIQNAIDSSAEFRYAFEGDTFTVGSPGIALDSKTLILGVTSKADDDSKIGSFGEGYKIAMVVLLREGLTIEVANGNVDWIPEFRHSETYGAEILCVDEFRRDSPAHSLEFRIGGLSHTDTNDIYNSCLLMQPQIEDAISVPMGRILPSHSNKLYVGGLFVCGTELDYGYDIKPEHVRLERDRMTVDSWDLKSVVRDMWFSTKDWDGIAEKMEQGMPDLSHAEYSSPELVKEACYKLFIKNHGNKAMIASSQKEINALVEKGMTKVITANSVFKSAVSSHSSYKEAFAHKIRIAQPLEILSTWVERNQRGMSLPLRQEFKAILKAAKDWRTN